MEFGLENLYQHGGEIIEKFSVGRMALRIRNAMSAIG
jgi:hypothetical protein